MIIYKTSHYKRALKNKIMKKNKEKENQRIIDIENLILNSPTLEGLLMNPFSKIYSIEQKSGDLREIYTAAINKKIRLWMKPKSAYPYNNKVITEIEFIDIDDKHYGEG